MSGIFDRVQSAVDARTPREGLSALDLLRLDAGDVPIVQLLLKRGASDAAALAAALERDPDDVAARLEALVADGFLRRSDDDVPRYWLHAERRRVRVPEGMWANLVDRTPPRTDDAGAGDAGSHGAAGDDDRGGASGGTGSASSDEPEGRR